MGCTVHKLVADVALYAEERVLLVRYADVKKYDGQTGWFLPDDYLRRLEHPADAAARIAREQLGLTTPLELAEIETFNGDAWHIVFHYRGRLERAEALRAGKNVADLEWFPLDALPPAEEVAHHGWAINVIGKMTA
jgi:ADP-ribose pyrophosphatase YjhB (NUDIX family)